MARQRRHYQHCDELNREQISELAPPAVGLLHDEIFVLRQVDLVRQFERMRERCTECQCGCEQRDEEDDVVADRMTYRHRILSNGSCRVFVVAYSCGSASCAGR